MFVITMAAFQGRRRHVACPAASGPQSLAQLRIHGLCARAVTAMVRAVHSTKLRAPEGFGKRGALLLCRRLCRCSPAGALSAPRLRG